MLLSSLLPEEGERTHGAHIRLLLTAREIILKWINTLMCTIRYTNAGIFVVCADVTNAMCATLLRRHRYVTIVLRHTYSFASWLQIQFQNFLSGNDAVKLQRWRIYATRCFRVRKERARIFFRDRGTLRNVFRKSRTAKRLICAFSMDVMPGGSASRSGLHGEIACRWVLFFLHSD